MERFAGCAAATETASAPLCADVPRESRTVRVNDEVTALVGVPATLQPDRESPGFREPVANVQV